LNKKKSSFEGLIIIGILSISLFIKKMFGGFGYIIIGGISLIFILWCYYQIYLMKKELKEKSLKFKKKNKNKFNLRFEND